MPRTSTTSPSRPVRRFAVVGAGLAGLACARTLAQAGHEVTVVEKAPAVGGRLTSRSSPFGSFDAGAQYFTVRDPRFRQALETAPRATGNWNATAVRVLDPQGRVAEAALPQHEPRWVGTPSMDSVAQAWARPLVDAGALVLDTQVDAIERDALDGKRWQLHTSAGDGAVQVLPGFDAVLLAIPAGQAAGLLQLSRQAPAFVERLQQVQVAPCWTLMLAFPQATQPGGFGPQWNAAFSTHHRIAWLARESSKPGRGPVERWTVHASPAWSTEHVGDDAPRVEAKLLKAFAEVTGIRLQPAHSEVKRWLHAKTLAPLGRSHLWDARLRMGAAGDWCLGHRVEDAFVSGLELALAANAA